MPAAGGRKTFPKTTPILAVSKSQSPRVEWAAVTDCLSHQPGIVDEQHVPPSMARYIVANPNACQSQDRRVVGSAGPKDGALAYILSAIPPSLGRRVSVPRNRADIARCRRSAYRRNSRRLERTARHAHHHTALTGGSRRKERFPISGIPVLWLRNAGPSAIARGDRLDLRHY